MYGYLIFCVCELKFHIFGGRGGVMCNVRLSFVQEKELAVRQKRGNAVHFSLTTGIFKLASP
jgi:hypothetical protein